MKEVEDLKTLAKSAEKLRRSIKRLEQKSLTAARRRGKRGKH